MLGYANSDVCELAHDIMCREFGVLELSDYGKNEEEKIFNFLLICQKVEEIIDTIDLLFHLLDSCVRENECYQDLAPDDAIAELNERFKENGVGFQFEGGGIIRMDSTYIHAEITKPTISLLQNKAFLGANDEFLSAHKKYLDGDNKGSINECLKSLESTLKTICNKKKWEYKDTATASSLIQICIDMGLIPSFEQTQFTALISLLQNLIQSGVPTIRNKTSGHGQGEIPKEVSGEIARYALSLTGANIIFLIESSGL